VLFSIEKEKYFWKIAVSAGHGPEGGITKVSFLSQRVVAQISLFLAGSVFDES